jgi:hypothetical protein
MKPNPNRNHGKRNLPVAMRISERKRQLLNAGEAIAKYNEAVEAIRELLDAHNNLVANHNELRHRFDVAIVELTYHRELHLQLSHAHEGILQRIEPLDVEVYTKGLGEHAAEIRRRAKAAQQAAEQAAQVEQAAQEAAQQNGNSPEKEGEEGTPSESAGTQGGEQCPTS